MKTDKKVISIKKKILQFEKKSFGFVKSVVKLCQSSLYLNFNKLIINFNNSIQSSKILVKLIEKQNCIFCTLGFFEGKRFKEYLLQTVFFTRTLFLVIFKRKSLGMMKKFSIKKKILIMKIEIKICQNHSLTIL